MGVFFEFVNPEMSGQAEQFSMNVCPKEAKEVKGN